MQSLFGYSHQMNLDISLIQSRLTELEHALHEQYQPIIDRQIYQIQQLESQLEQQNNTIERLETQLHDYTCAMIADHTMQMEGLRHSVEQQSLLIDKQTFRMKQLELQLDKYISMNDDRYFVQNTQLQTINTDMIQLNNTYNDVTSKLRRELECYDIRYTILEEYMLFNRYVSGDIKYNIHDLLLSVNQLDIRFYVSDYSNENKESSIQISLNKYHSKFTLQHNHTIQKIDIINFISLREGPMYSFLEKLKNINKIRITCSGMNGFTADNNKEEINELKYIQSIFNNCEYTEVSCIHCIKGKCNRTHCNSIRKALGCI